MSLDITELQSAEDLFAGMASSQHDYYRTNNLVEMMADAMLAEREKGKESA